MISFVHKGDFSSTRKFLKRAKEMFKSGSLDEYGRQGVEALRAATPIDSGVTAESWGYKIEITNGSVKIIWTNSNQNDSVPIVVLIQYGHGLWNGGYVQGNDFINPAMRPVFKDIADNAWKEVTGR